MSDDNLKKQLVDQVLEILDEGGTVEDALQYLEDVGKQAEDNIKENNKKIRELRKREEMILYGEIISEDLID